MMLSAKSFLNAVALLKVGLSLKVSSIYTYSNAMRSAFIVSAFIVSLFFLFSFTASNAQAGACGDAVRVVGEQCDDGNVLNGDGCNSSCQVEWGYSSCGVDAPASCGTVCGDGIKVSTELCDDGNNINGDGCSASCDIETSLTFSCAMQNDQKQRDAFPDYISPRANGERALNSGLQPLSANFEPMLEEVPYCNGLSWQPAAEITVASDSRHLVEYQFLVVLDKSWIDNYNANQANFLTQGYDSLERSPQILFERASYLFEAQFGVRVGISRVVVVDTLEQKCQSTGGAVENNIQDNTHTPSALASRGIEKLPSEMGIVRLGVDPPNVYCASYTNIANWSGSFPFVVNTEHAFSNGLLRHRAAVTLAHELAHFFGIMQNSSHPHYLNAHIANEIPDIMVWNGQPIQAVRPDGMFFKFLTSCTPAYDEFLCAGVKATSSSLLATPLICFGGNADCLLDTDADGAPDNCAESPATCLSASVLSDTDDDNDGIADGVDGFPLIHIGDRADTDSDGIPNNCSALQVEGFDHSQYGSETYYRINSQGDRVGFVAGLTGTYRRDPYQNAWHLGTLTENGDNYLWTNEAGVSWNMSLDTQNLVLQDVNGPYQGTLRPLRHNSAANCAGMTEDAFVNAVTQITDVGITVTTGLQAANSSCSLTEVSAEPYTLPSGFIGATKQFGFLLSGCESEAETVQVTIDFGEDMPEGAIVYSIHSGTLTAIDEAVISGNVVAYDITDNDAQLDADNNLGAIAGQVTWAIPVLVEESVPAVPTLLIAMMAGLLSLLGIRQVSINRK